MIQYYANIMKPGYKSELIQLKVSSLSEAKSATIKIAEQTSDCIGYSTAVKEPRKRLYFV